MPAVACGSRAAMPQGVSDRPCIRAHIVRQLPSSRATLMNVVSDSPSALSTMPHCESAAVAEYAGRELESQIDAILSIALMDAYEDGMEGRMSQALRRFVFRNSQAGMHQLSARLNSEYLNHGVAADIVRALAKIQHEPSHCDRVFLAECLLCSELPIVRDSAAVALSDLSDKRSIPALERAIKAESVPSLKADIQASLDELIKDSHVIGSENS